MWRGFKKRNYQAFPKVLGRLSYGVLIALLGLAVISSIAWLMLPARDQAKENFDQADSFDRFYTKGVNLKSFDMTGETAYSFRADEIIHTNDKIGFMTLRAVKRLELHNVLLQYREAGNAESPGTAPTEGTDTTQVTAARLPVVETLTNSLSVIPKDLGLVRKTLIDRFEVRVVDGAGRFMTIKSNSARLDPERSVVVLQGKVTLRAYQDRLFAKTVDWLPRGGRFAVKGPFFVGKKGSKPSVGRDQVLMVVASGLERVER